MILALAAFLPAPATAAAPQGDATTYATWARAASVADAEAALQSELARLQPGQIRPYLDEVVKKLEGMPPALRGAAGRLLKAHLPLLGRASADPALVDWFAKEAAGFLADDDEPEGALALLADTAPLLPHPSPYWGQRWRLEIDCLIVLQQFVSADRRCAEIEARVDEPLDRVRLLARRATLDVMLGRLDQANRRFAAATRQLDELSGIDARELRKQRFKLLERQLDLLGANEQFAAVHTTIARFVAERERAGEPLSPEERLSLDVSAVAADYHATQHQPEREAAVRASLEALRNRVDRRLGVRLTLWLADLEVRANHTVRATALLAAAAKSVNRGNEGLAAVIAAELARRTGGSRDVLLGHEAALRTILQGMIAEWREIALEGESTGFLRLGVRLRVLGELITLTSSLHGDERALEDVLAVQCCTRSSRARGAEPVPLAEIRAKLLDTGCGALVFAPAWNESHVFACDRDVVLRGVLPRASELRLQAAALRQELLALAREPVPGVTLATLRERSRTLAQDLLPESVRVRMEGWNHLVVTGANLLGSPPFACLPWDDDKLLGERFALATTASLPLLVRLHAEAGAPVPAAALPVRLFATLTPAAAFAARNELGPPDELAGPRWDRLLGLLPGAAVTVGASATVSAYVGSTPSPRLTFLLAHGEAPGVESPAALGLSPDTAHEDGLLTPEVVRSVPQQGVHVISSCHGAHGRVRMGDDDGAESLADALLFAGATAVVASPAQLRASLHLEADAELAAALLEGVTPAEALRRARLAVAGRDPVQRYRAAQLELIGLGTVPLVSAPARWPAWPWLVAALLAAAITIRVRLRRRAIPCP